MIFLSLTCRKMSDRLFLKFQFDVDLPKKHGRGGQSALRFARLRMEKRHNYVRKVAETAVKCFIKDDKVNVAGLILAGSADFKTELNGSDMFDQRLAAKVIRTVDVSYGGENGFNQAIELVAEDLSNVKFVQEKKLICKLIYKMFFSLGKFTHLPFTHQLKVSCLRKCYFP